MSRVRFVRVLTLGIALAIAVGLALVVGPDSWRNALPGSGPAGGRPSAAGPGTTGTPTPTPTPTIAPPVLLAAQKGLSSPVPGGVATALADALDDPAIGSERGVAVAGETGGLLLDADSATPRTPASTLKILTAVAALEALGPDARLTTAVELTAPGAIVLVGGGDPALSQRTEPDDDWPYPVTSLDGLADQTAGALLSAGVTSVTLSYRDDLFAGPAVSAAWSDSYVSSGQVGPVSALAVDGGREQPGESRRSDDPAAYAAELFAQSLAAAGVEVEGEPAAAPAATGAQIAAVQSPTVADLVAQLLLRSDNDVAEVLARHVARATGAQASFAGLGQAIPAVLDKLGVPVTGLSLDDGSGLSRGNQVAPDSLVVALQLALDAAHPELAAVASSLPVAGFSGTLEDRFADEQSARQVGDIRAKTGYLNGVVALAGYVVDEDGTPIVFALIADGVDLEDTLDAQRSADRLAASLAGCGCS